MPKTITINGDEASILTKCLGCEDEKTFHLDAGRVMRWQAGEFIQNVFPELSIQDRERLISGTCPTCFAKFFPPEENDV